MNGLVTDFYELTMAYAYWKSGMAELEATFSMTFRENPFGGGFTVACGTGPVADLLENFRYDQPSLAYLESLEGNDGQPLFSRPFLDYLGELRLTCDVDAVPEGSIVFPHEPLLRVSGSILQAQIVESAILNVMNFQSLIATKAARVVLAAAGDRVVEFGLRRAQGLDGALSASRAAFIGGCSATSHVLAGKTYGIPVAGTLAHSFVMAFDSEQEAFDTFVDAMPNNAILLVDTYDTMEGVRRAVEIGRALQHQGHRLAGVRLDSGDLAPLSIEARRILDEAGFEQASIAASNDLDEHLIASLKEKGARIDLWGVGTRLVTAWDQPALGGVYKLNAVRKRGSAWESRIKLSEQTGKTSIPGIVGIRRYAAGKNLGDLLYDELDPPAEGDVTIIDPIDPTRRRTLAAPAAPEELLQPLIRNGERVAGVIDIGRIRERVQRELAGFSPGIKRLESPERYPVGLEEGLFRRRAALALEMRSTDRRTPV
ncbi:MAG TPA: nicotinate phosphoribosyltransferase [Thermoanaerobaculia bacterium]|nr:nicotinate phosphoribosyltransferase [Thermoanaerobaculia bacterium]